MKRLIVSIAFVLAVGSARAGQIDAAKLRGYLDVPFATNIGMDFTSLFKPGQRIPCNPNEEIVRLKRQLTGKPTDAPIHLRMGDLYRMVSAGQRGDPYAGERDREYELAAQQYEALLKDNPLDTALVVGYVRSSTGSIPSGPIPWIDEIFGAAPGEDGKSREIEEMLRKVIEIHPEAWEARLELADRMEGRAMKGLIAGLMKEQMQEKETKDADAENAGDKDTGAAKGPSGLNLPEPLSLEAADQLYKEAAEQRDLAVKFAPRQSGAYVGRFTGRLGGAVHRYALLGMAKRLPKMDEAAVARLVRRFINPSDLRKALQCDPENATVLRALVFFEIVNVLLDESSRKSFEELLEGVLAQDPSKRTWNLISAANRTRLSRYEGKIRYAIGKRPPDVWSAHEALGLLKTFQGELKEAETAFMVAARLSARAYLSYLALFIYHGWVPIPGSDRARAERVIPIWEMRVRLSGSPGDMLELAGAYIEAERLDKAESLVRQALRMNSEDAAAQHMLGVVILKRQGNPQEAIGRLEKALSSYKEQDDRDRARVNLAIAYAIAGDVDKAREELKEIGGGQRGRAQEVLKELDVSP